MALAGSNDEQKLGVENLVGLSLSENYPTVKNLPQQRYLFTDQQWTALKWKV